MKGASEDELIAHAQAVAQEIPLIGFYLQPAVGGIVLPVSFWRRFAAIENVIAIKIAPFNRYRTLDVVRGVVEAGAVDRVTLYTGNDDHIVLDLLVPVVIKTGGKTTTVRIKGGLLGHWSVWVKKAVELLDRLHAASGADTLPVDLLTLDSQVTDCNAAVFDVANDFHGVIAGCHEILRRQGLLEGIWCLDPNETLGPGQKEEIDRILCGLSASQRRRLCAGRTAKDGLHDVARPIARCRFCASRAHAIVRGHICCEATREPRIIATIFAGRAQPPAAGGRVAGIYRRRQRTEIRHAVALGDVSGTRRSQLSMDRKHHGDDRRNFRRIHPCGRRRHRHRLAVLVVSLARNYRHAFACQPQHDPEGRVGPAHHRLVQVRHRSQYHDGLRHLLLPDHPDDNAWLARSRARSCSIWCEH